MIKEINLEEKKRYGRFFLSLEAPLDEEQDDNIKFNTKIITVNPSNRKSSFLKPMDGEEDLPVDMVDEPVEDMNMDTQTDDAAIPDETPAPEVSIDGEVVDSPMDDTAPVIDEDPLVTQINDTNNEIDANSNVDFTQDVPTDDMGTEINTDEPVTDDVDFTQDDGMAGDPAIDPGMEQPVDGMAPQGEVKKGPGIEYDSTRKYVLFTKYIDLCNAIQNYIDRFDSLMSDNINENNIYRKASNALSDIYNITYDYIVMRYELSSYVESLLFFQEKIVSISKVFEFVKSSRSTLQKKEPTKKVY